MSSVSTMVALCAVLFLCCLGLTATSPAPAPMWSGAGWIDASGRFIQDITEGSKQLDIPITSHHELAPLPESLTPLWPNLHQQASTSHYSAPSLKQFDSTMPSTYEPLAHHGFQADPVEVIDLDPDDGLPSTSKLTQQHISQSYPPQTLSQPSSMYSPADHDLGQQTSMNLSLMQHLPPLRLKLDISSVQSRLDTARTSGFMTQGPLDQHMRRPSNDNPEASFSSSQRIDDAPPRAHFAPTTRPAQETEPEGVSQYELAHMLPILELLGYPSRIELPLYTSGFSMVPWPKLCDELRAYRVIKNQLPLDRLNDITAFVVLHHSALRSELETVFRSGSSVYAYNLPSGLALIRFHTRTFGREADNYERRLTVWTIGRSSDGSPLLTTRGVFACSHRAIVVLTEGSGKAKYVTRKRYSGGRTQVYLELEETD